MVFSIRNSYRGAFIYAIGDAVAACVLDEFSLKRFFGMMVVGGILYAFEIPNYFSWIEKKTAQLKGARKSVIKTTLALVFFNPLWIARHLLIIQWLNTGSMH